MSDNLNDIENLILDSIYRKDYEKDLEFKININDFPLTEIENNHKIHEVGYYLERLKRLNYLDFRDKSLLRADGTHEKYKNNIYMIWWDDIHISYKGKCYVEESRKRFSDRVFESSKNLIVDVGKEIRNKIVSHLATFIFGIIVSYLYYFLFIR